MKEVYVVTYWSDVTTEPIVTVFNNKKNADMAYDYFIKSYNCCIDKCPVYEDFIVKKGRIK